MTLYDHNLVPWLQLSGQYIVQERPAEERTQWVIMLLEEMRPFLSSEEFEALLRNVVAAVQQKLDENGG